MQTMQGNYSPVSWVKNISTHMFLVDTFVVADTLSRYSPEDTPEVLLDISISHVYVTGSRTYG